MRNIFVYLLITLLWNQVVTPQGIIGTTLGETSGPALYFYTADSVRKVFERDGWIFQNENIQNSPNEQYLAAIIRARELDRDESGRPFINHQLLLFNKSGKLLFSLPDVIRFVWSPNSKRIAYVKARGDYENYDIIPRTLEVVEIRSQKVHSFSLDTYEDIAWANHDSMIYFTNYARVFRVNPRTGEKSETPYKGINFSPDGKYYFVANYEGGTFAVYEREANRDITPKEFEGNPRINFHHWLPDGSTLVFGDMFHDKQVFDAAASAIKKTISGQMLGYDKRTNEFIVIKHKRYFPNEPDKRIEKIRNRQ